MYIKVIKPKTDGKKTYNNAGSCIPLVKYLSKEDDEKGVNREMYFTTGRDMVTGQEVIKAIDNNSPKISKGEARFYSIVIAPKAEEMEHLKNDKNELKKYAVDAMNIYAGEFKKKNGKGKNLQGSDLVWYGKLEEKRYYQGNDQSVIEGKAKQGDPLPGDNTHIHIIVSRQDKTKTQKLSPLVNSKKLFHREAFKLKACELFDEKYSYKGSGEELKKHIIMRDGSIEERVAYLEKEEQKRIAKLQKQAKQIEHPEQEQTPKQEHIPLAIKEQPTKRLR